MSKHLLWKENGVETWIESDGFGNHSIARVEDLTPAIDRNKRLQNDEDYGKRGIKAGFQHIAFIPNWVLETWYHQGKIKSIFATAEGDEQRIQRLLNSPDWKYLKTWHGKV